jgi:hypothetical protein
MLTLRLVIVFLILALSVLLTPLVTAAPPILQQTTATFAPLSTRPPIQPRATNTPTVPGPTPTITLTPTTIPLMPYRNDTLGFTLQHPTNWLTRESAATRTVTLAADSDWARIDKGLDADGLVLTLSLSTFRQIALDRTDDFGEHLRRVEKQPNAAYRQVQLGGANGVLIELQDGKTGVAGRTVMLSVGQRRVIILRGVATIRGWSRGGRDYFDAITSTLSFFPSGGIATDRIGRIIWGVHNPQFGGFADVGATADGITVFATDPQKGIWSLNANGVVNGVQTFPDIKAYGSIALFRDGTRYVADSVSHVIWVIQANGSVRRIVGGSVGSGRGQFGAESPKSFAFGFQNTFNILDQQEGGKTRIQVVGRGGEFYNFWEIPTVQNGSIATDANGYIYVVGTNTNGIIKLGANGKIQNPALGRSALQGSTPYSLAVDRFGNIFVGTDESGVLKLNDDGRLIGVIGEAYDESAPPKPGQLAKPTALALNSDSTILYIGDSGKYPSLTAVALDGNAAINIEAATQAMGAIGYGASLNGEITDVAFVRTYTFQGTVGETVTISVLAAENSFDPFVELLDSSNRRLAANDDGKIPGRPTTDAQIKGYKLGYTGSYTIRVTRFGREAARGVGQYTVNLEKN